MVVDAYSPSSPDLLPRQLGPYSEEDSVPVVVSGEANRLPALGQKVGEVKAGKYTTVGVYRTGQQSRIVVKFPSVALVDSATKAAESKKDVKDDYETALASAPVDRDGKAIITPKLRQAIKAENARRALNDKRAEISIEAGQVRVIPLDVRQAGVAWVTADKQLHRVEIQGGHLVVDGKHYKNLKVKPETPIRLEGGTFVTVYSGAIHRKSGVSKIEVDPGKRAGVLQPMAGTDTESPVIWRGKIGFGYPCLSYPAKTKEMYPQDPECIGAPSVTGSKN